MIEKFEPYKEFKVPDLRTDAEKELDLIMDRDAKGVPIETKKEAIRRKIAEKLEYYKKKYEYWLNESRKINQN